MNFKEFFLREAGGLEWGYAGNMNVILGSGEPETLHYGTAPNFPQPMLYVPVPRKVSKRYLEEAKETIFYCRGNGEWRCQNSFVGKQTVNTAKEASATGESHLTIASGRELQQVLARTGMTDIEALKHMSLEAPFSPEKKEGLTYLFDDNNHGIDCKLSVANAPGVTAIRQVGEQATPRPHPNIKMWSTKLFAGEPMAIVLFMEANNLVPIRHSVGLSPLPQLPPQLGAYVPHTTIGYIFLPDIEEAGYKIRTTYKVHKKDAPMAKYVHDTTYKQRTRPA